MAEHADGSIIIDTELDSQGFKKGSDELQKALKSLGSKMDSLGPTFDKALKGNAKAIGEFIDTPTKEPTVSTEYVFDKWDKELTNVTADRIVNATFTEQIRKYTITFLDDDGSVLQSSLVAYGTKPFCENPTREDTAQYFYDFDGWDKAISEVTCDETYRATYIRTLRTYTVTWVDEDGSSLLEEDVNVSYGEMPSYDGETPTKQGNAQYTYTFAGWHIEISEVKGNMIYIATYTAEVNKYTVIWKNADGTVLETDEKVPYGDMPEYNGSPPTKEGDAQYSYSFLGWDTAVSEVTGDVVYTAVYTQHTRSYTIKFVNYDGSELKSEVLEYGSMPIAPTPSRTGYDFTGWDSSVATVTGDKTYTAQYKIKTFTITWKIGDSTTTQTYNYNSTPVYPNGTPILAGGLFPEANVFKGWSPSIATVTDNATYTAQFQLEGITGNCGENNGDNVQYLVLNGTLYVRGSGKTVTISGTNSNSPFEAYDGTFSTIVIGGGITLCGRFFNKLTGIKKVVIDRGVTTYDEPMLFNGTTGDIHIEIPDDWTTIPGDMFYKCTGITNIIVPISVTEVTSNAFYGASNLENVYYRGSSTQWSAMSKGGNSAFTSATIHYNFTGTLDDIIDA